MSNRSPRRNAIIAALVLFVLALLLLVRCTRTNTPPPQSSTAAPSVAPGSATAAAPAADTPPAPETLTPATVSSVSSVGAGKVFSVTWTGPRNPRDYITITSPEADDSKYLSYADVEKGSPADLLAPIEPGTYEIRYVAVKSRKVLGRAPIVVTANEATIQAPAEAVAGSTIEVNWTGPNNGSDYLTFVAKSLPDGRYGNYTYTAKGSPLQIVTPIEPGDGEIRYMTGQGAKVIARVPVSVVPARIELSAPAIAAAGTKVEVTWKGPNFGGDYITIVPASLPDGQYRGYANTSSGSPVMIAVPGVGPAEIRYVSGQGARTLQRRPILITP